MHLKKVSNLIHGDVIFDFGKVYHVWYNHHKYFVAVKGKKVRSFFPEEKVLIDVGCILPLESEMMFRDRMRQLWMEPV